MSPLVSAVGIGLSRGWTEFRQSLTRLDEQVGNVIFAIVFLVVLYFQRDTIIPGTTLPLAVLALPGVIGMLVAFNTLSNASFLLSTEREDGTLLRAKAAPFGVAGYLAGLTVRIPLTVLLSVAFVLVPGLFLFDGPTPHWLGLAGMLALGLLAALPIGMIVGGLASSPRAVGGWIFLVSGGLVAISGIFYPITALPGWLHPMAQVFPFYWIGLGMRSALLPDAAVAVEIAGSWRHLETVAVLGAWAVVGLGLAPGVLRRMARRQSGASVEKSRQKAMQRIG